MSEKSSCVKKKKKSWAETLYSYKHAGASYPKGSATLMNMKGVSVRSGQGIMHRLTCIQSYTTKVFFFFFSPFFFSSITVCLYVYFTLNIRYVKIDREKIPRSFGKKKCNLCIELRARSVDIHV